MVDRLFLFFLGTFLLLYGISAVFPALEFQLMGLFRGLAAICAGVIAVIRLVK